MPIAVDSDKLAQPPLTVRDGLRHIRAPSGALCFSRSLALFELHAEDFVALRSARRADFGCVADGLADKRASERRLHRNLILLEIRLVRADELIGRFLVGFDVGHRDGGAKAHDLAARKLKQIDHVGAADDILELADAAFDEALALRARGDIPAFSERLAACSRASAICLITA